MKIEVIIADDHQLFIEGIKSILSNELDISIVAEANNGLELIKLLESGIRANIILTDIRMPVMDGVAVTRILSKDYPEIPILALSMLDHSADVYEMLEAGAKGYITKEITKEELVKAIHTVVAGSNYFASSVEMDREKWQKMQNPHSNIELTRREREILRLIAKGRTTLEIAQELKLSKFTVDTHRKNIHKKLNIKSNTGLVNYAIKNN